MRRKSIEITEKISEVIKALDSLVVPENIKIVLPKNNAEVMCDKKQLTIVFSNILLNGIQAIGKFTIVEIQITENDFVTIQVKDSGIGIPKDDLNQIFTPLFTTKLEGTGLGLASVRSIIDSHKGTISVSSPPTVLLLHYQNPTPETVQALEDKALKRKQDLCKPYSRNN